MKKIIILSVLVATSFSLFAQKDTVKQFILIVRYNPKMSPPAPEALQNNIKHWNEFMGGLAQNGQLVTGYRPTNDGKVVTSKEIKDGVYTGNNESVSSVLIIKATGMEAAQSIAQKCPILEFNGSVEIRPLMQTAN